MSLTIRPAPTNVQELVTRVRECGHCYQIQESKGTIWRMKFAPDPKYVDVFWECPCHCLNTSRVYLPSIPYWTSTEAPLNSADKEWLIEIQQAYERTVQLKAEKAAKDAAVALEKKQRDEELAAANEVYKILHGRYPWQYDWNAFYESREINDVINQLTDREQYIVKQKKLQRSFASIGKDLKLSGGRTNQIFRKALRKLRKLLDDAGEEYTF